MDVFPKRSTESCYAVIFSILLHRMFVALQMSKPSKNSVSQQFCYHVILKNYSSTFI